MKKDSSLSVFIYIFGPAVLFIVISEAVTAAMNLLWELYLQGPILQGEGTAAASHMVLTLWKYLCLMIPAAVGCLAVRRQAQLERDAFPAARGQRLLFGLSAQARDEARQRVLPILLPAVVFTALGINALAAFFFPAAGSRLPLDTLPGIAGFLLQAACFSFFIPYVEETVFRAILYPRLQRWIGTGGAILLSALFFGLYHGTPLQAFYAFVMGILFAVSYEAFGRFSIPYALHGCCNLAVLFLQWTDCFGKISTPAWAAVFLGVGAAGFFTIRLLIKKCGTR